MNRKPIVAAEHHHSDFVLKLMNEHKVYQIPVVDAKNHLIGLHIWDTFSSISRRESRTIIMAGGKGIRLRPETLTCPKPMLEIAHKPILQHIIERIRNDGFYKISIAINYMGDMIEEFFESGEKFGVEIDYIREKLLGTAGALSLLPMLPDRPFFVINGDVITDIKMSEILNFTITIKPLELWQ